MATLTQDAPLGDETSASHWRQRVDRAFSRAAPRYRQLARAQLAMAQSLLDDLPPRQAQARQNTENDHGPVRTVLDLGCGPGDLTWQMCDRYPNAQVIGLDLSLAMGSLKLAVMLPLRTIHAPAAPGHRLLCG